MKRLLFLAALGFILASPLSHADSRVGKHVDDPRRILPANAVWRRATEDKLDAFERTAEIKILVQFHEKSPSAEEDKIPGAYMHALATRLGVEEHGVLVVYFADDPDWRIWIGDELTPLFVGHAGTTKELTESGAIHEVKEALLKAAAAKAEAQAAATPQIIPAEKVRLQADALLDALIEKLSARKP